METCQCADPSMLIFAETFEGLRKQACRSGNATEGESCVKRVLAFTNVKLIAMSIQKYRAERDTILCLPQVRVIKTT